MFDIDDSKMIDNFIKLDKYMKEQDKEDKQDKIIQWLYSAVIELNQRLTKIEERENE